jgi:phosphatidylinositol alpha-1,6-mannosyltransferase
MIEALPLVLEAFPKTTYLIVGEGPQGSHLRTLVKTLGLEDNVIFVGQVKEDELGAYYAACDVFAMVSRDIPEKGDVEGFGIVYLEANLFGKPVVAGRSGGVPDAVLNEQTGLLVNPHDPQEVASAIVRLLRDPELAERLGTNGRNRVRDEFTGSAAADKLLRALAA